MPRPKLSLGRLRGTGRLPSKLLSLSLLICAVAALIWLFTEPRWFVYAENVEVSELTYLDAAELVRAADVEGWSILWLRPHAIRERLMEHAYVADADVSLRLPNRVLIAVEEAHPVALWVTKKGTFWLREDGTALPSRSEIDPTLPRIIDGLQDARALHRPDVEAINRQVLDSGLALMQQLPELENNVRYDRGVGFNFHLPTDAVWIYWGDGYNTQTKLSNLSAMRTLVTNGEEPAQIIDVRYLNRPYLR
ncbi:MAG: FtsQ-type POTRA domain-containing protein [Caldilineaceae bacterium]|nr:FtsQ-type POTRA domain-containing protein [Caldilineaceae bacterium]